ncbi:MAG: HIT family protein [Planctomycetes bacterium]|nr:HIT family protein [Planctomycetota bacterium]
MPDCIFCKIIKGEIPAAKLYEDERCIAILDINPIALGHTLFISRSHYATLADIPEKELGLLTEKLPRVCRAIVKGTGSEGFNIIENNGRCSGQIIPHLHFHIIPRRANDEVRFNWSPRVYQKDEMSRVAQAITDCL